MNVFNKPYTRDSFIDDFLVDFLPDDFEIEETTIPRDFSASYLGEITRIGTCKSLELEVFEMIHSSLNDARIGVAKDAFKVLHRYSLCNRALVIFVPSSSPLKYRFSLLQINASLDINDRLTRTYSNPRRFSFLLGKEIHIKTPTQFLIEKGPIRERQEGSKLLTPFEDLLSRFSVEVLTKQFYNELFKWYGWAIDLSAFPKGKAADVLLTKDMNEQNIIRLITRIMFVWFIKQKKIVPDKLFNLSELSSVINDFDPVSSKSGNYYNAILQNLFFATLNRAIIDEKGFKRQFTEDNPSSNNPHYGIKSFYRDNKAPNKSLFKISHQEVINYFSTIPFLNGGLFECLDDLEDNSDITQEYIDGFSREPSRRAFIPNILFFHPDLGLIPLLSRYNFTVEENSPKEIQVALDPELLGKVFENLLGAYNPETRETARNQSGSFYTPREIVEYMVDESLKAYLGESELVMQLFSQDDLPLELQKNPVECERILNKLYSVKILDPACGSGAFPMGILNRMVEIITKLGNKKEDQIGQLKSQLIEQCIYGSDIQTIAVQISKLRFFISLICHYEKNDNDPINNYGIPMLPNLETKFVAANTLNRIKQIEGFGSMFTDPTGEIEKKKKELLRIRKKHFSAHSSFLKIELREQDRKTRKKLAELLTINIYAPEDARQLAEWNPYDQNKSSTFFDAYWMFGVSEGFDIVIGNPPYIQLQNNQGQLADLYKHSNFSTYARTGDIYSLFYERGWQLLKKGGHLCFITSNKWMRAGYGEKTREFFATKTNPKLLVDFAGLKLFESATVDTNILLFANENNVGKTICAVMNNDKSCLKELSVYVKQNHSLTDFGAVGSDSWVILSDIELRIKQKIESVGIPLKDWDIKINYGIKTGYNQAFIVTTEKRSEILANCQSEDERKRTEALIRPILRGRDIKRYRYDWANLWLINTHNGIKGKFPKIRIEDYPAIRSHLDEYWVHIRDRADQGDTPYNLRNCAYMDLFFQPKICWKAVGRQLAFSIVEPGIYLSAPASFISARNSNQYILAFLCSLVGKYFIYTNSDRTGAGDIMLNIQSIVKFPIPIPNENEQKTLTSLVLDSNEKGIEDYISLKLSLTDEEIKYMKERTK